MENGGRKTVLDELLDNAPTSLALVANQPPNIVSDRIYAKQYHLPLSPNQPMEIHGTISVAPFAPGDLNCDGKLEFTTDFPVFLQSFGGKVSAPGIPPDYNGDGVVGLSDYSIFRGLFK